jgi:hypothetical protein
MALRSLGSVARGGIRAWSSSSPPGIQAARSESDAHALRALVICFFSSQIYTRFLVSPAVAHDFMAAQRNAFFHVDSRNGPAAAAPAALSALAGSRGLHGRVNLAPPLPISIIHNRVHIHACVSCLCRRSRRAVEHPGSRSGSRRGEEHFGLPVW